MVKSGFLMKIGEQALERVNYSQAEFFHSSNVRINDKNSVSKVLKF